MVPLYMAEISAHPETEAGDFIRTLAFMNICIRCYFLRYLMHFAGNASRNGYIYLGGS